MLNYFHGKHRWKMMHECLEPFRGKWPVQKCVRTLEICGKKSSVDMWESDRARSLPTMNRFELVSIEREGKNVCKPNDIGSLARSIIVLLFQKFIVQTCAFTLTELFPVAVVPVKIIWRGKRIQQWWRWGIIWLEINLVTNLVIPVWSFTDRVTYFRCSQIQTIKTPSIQHRFINKRNL